MANMTYRKKMWGLAALAIGVSVAVGLISGVITRDFATDATFWIVFPGLILLFAIQFSVAWPWWKRLDDLQKQAHLLSWYFGGMGGAVILLVWLFADKIHKSDFGIGAMAMFGAQVAGFFVYYLFWWLRGRGAAE